MSELWFLGFLGLCSGIYASIIASGAAETWSTGVVPSECFVMTFPCVTWENALVVREMPTLAFTS